MSKKELRETLIAIARTRGEPTIKASDYFGALNKLEEIKREVSQAIYDDGMNEMDLAAVIEDSGKRISK